MRCCSVGFGIPSMACLLVSGFAHGERTEVVALAEADAVVAKDRVRVRHVEKEIRYGVLEEIVRATHDFPLPAGRRNRAAGGTVEVLLAETVQVGEHGADARV